ncbi:hypothetical protein CKO51_27250 [Rhodopirellula sp. SM50]|nr:hypothetical protein CKO51_27250 [Rhodopirellula sp. SM50]
MVTELWRRFPHRFTLFETHPGGGAYDTLDLIDRTDSARRLQVNRGGSVHVWGLDENRSWSDWLDRMLDDEPQIFLDEITEALGRQVVQTISASTPTTITYRFIAEFLTHSIGRRERWECRNGFGDSSVWTGGKRQDWFDVFPHIADHSPPQRLENQPIETAYCYWFLIRNSEPQLCIDTDGVAYCMEGTAKQLPELYAKSRRIWSVVNSVAGDLLP